MTKRSNATRSDRPPVDIETFTSGEVRLRRTPLALARRFFQICTAAVAEALAGEDLTPPQMAVLVGLSKAIGEPGIDQNGLAARLGYDRARVSQLVDELEALGLIDRRVNGADRRARLLRLTPRGEKLRARVHPAGIGAQMRVLAGLAANERELLLDLLVRVVQSNPALARPGAARRKRGSRQSTASKSRPSPSSNL
jgi:DNA-binding MarR family transcriptional regulator